MIKVFCNFFIFFIKRQILYVKKDLFSYFVGHVFKGNSSPAFFLWLLSNIGPKRDLIFQGQPQTMIWVCFNFSVPAIASQEILLYHERAYNVPFLLFSLRTLCQQTHRVRLHSLRNTRFSF